MRTSLGISAGNEVVCSALVATAANGAQSFDYRVVTADAAQSDLGDLVASSIELMTTPTSVRDVAHPTGAQTAALHPDAAEPPGTIAVAYRDREQAAAIRSAIGRRRHDVALIPESTAALTFLRHTGLLDRYDTAAIIDLGASGMTVTVINPADQTTLRSERTDAVSGAAADELIYHHLLDYHFARRGTRPNRSTLINRSRAAKEHLSIAPAVTIDHVAGQPLKLTRADFEELIAGLVREAAEYANRVFARSPKPPAAVAVIGGGANIPTIGAGLDALLDIPVIMVPEPESATAKGAALVADSAQPSTTPAVGPADHAPSGTFTKVVGTLVGAVAVVGLVVGYGIKEMMPTAEDPVNPLGTSNTEQVTSTPAPIPTTTATTTAAETGGGIGGGSAGGGETATATTAPIQQSPSRVEQPTGGNADTGAPAWPSPSPPADSSTSERLPTSTPDRTPSATTAPLRPDPNLPQIPLPDLPHLFGPFLDSNTPGAPTPQQPTPSQPTPDSSAPDSSAPGPSTSGQSAPGRSTSGEPTPGRSTPDRSTPNIAPGEPAPNATSRDNQGQDDHGPGSPNGSHLQPPESTPNSAPGAPRANSGSADSGTIRPTD